MRTKSIDVYIYIQSQQNENKNTDIVKAVANQYGVLKAGSNQNISKMLDVEYDPQRISGDEILNFVRSEGYTSYLVGM